MSSKNLVDNIISLCSNLEGPPIIEVDPRVFTETQVYRALKNKGYFVIQINKSPIKNKGELLIALDQVCSFPDYFGFNWDALADSLVDFHWRTANGYILMFNNPSNLDQADLEIFLEIVKDVSVTWADNNTPFKLLIPKNSISVEY